MKKIILLSLLVLFSYGKVISKIAEASGICYFEDKKTLFVANDEGTLFEINKKGKVLRKKRIGKYDLEGVTCDKKNIYLLDEQNKILKLSYKSLKIENIIKVKGIELDKKHGLEGISLKDNYFYISSQKYKKIFKLNQNGKIVDKFKVNYKDMAGLQIVDNKLYIVSDRNNKLIIYNLHKREIEKEYKLPKFAQEGITITKKYLFFADDNGRVLKIKKSKFE